MTITGEKSRYNQGLSIGYCADVSINNTLLQSSFLRNGRSRLGNLATHACDEGAEAIAAFHWPQISRAALTPSLAGPRPASCTLPSSPTNDT